MKASFHFATLAALLAAISFPTFAADLPMEVPIWPAGSSGNPQNFPEENVRVTDAGEHVVSGVHRPTITPFLPANASGAVARTAVIIAPGGGHRELWMHHEGYNLARWLSERGIAAFVLKYRLAREEGSTYSVDDESLGDLRRAIQLVRSRAGEWNVDPGRVGVLGFSAGGELAALSAMRFADVDPASNDPVARNSIRPDFQALIYPGGSRRFEAVKEAPPLFIVCGFGDRNDISRGMAELYLKYKEAGVPAELHVYANAGHGFGVRDRNRGAAGRWPERFVEWLADAGLN